MKKYISIMFFAVVGLVFSSCERDLSTENVTKGEIRHPSIVILGDSPLVTLPSSAAYSDPGAQALSGVDDISSTLEITGVDDVDLSTPGAYAVDYSVTVVNELGQETSVEARRWIVVTTEDISDTDFSGNYTSTSQSFGGASFGQKSTITQLGTGYYQVSDIYAHPSANQSARFFHLGGTMGLLQPMASSIFGEPLEGTITFGDDGNGNTTIDFHLNFPASGFSTTKPWVQE